MTRKNLIPAWFKALIFISMLVVSYGLTHSAPQPAQTSMETSENVAPMAGELFETLWIDKYPQLPADTWKAYMFTPDNIGISIDALSAYKLTIEIFEFKADKSRITFHFPHDSRRAGVGYKIEKLEKPTKQFDYQLTVDQDPQAGGTAHVYYTGPDFRSLDTMPSDVREALQSNQVIQNSLGKH